MYASDQELVAMHLDGDPESIEILIRRHLKPVYGFLYRYTGNAQDAEDITQDVFVKAWRHLKKFDRARNFKTWLFAIAKNSAIDFLKKKRAVPFSAFDAEKGGNALSDTLADSSPLPQALAERADAGRMLSAALEKLAPVYRTVLFLRYNDHFTFREIAESLDEPLDTVKSRHRRALMLLRKLLLES